MRSSRRPTPPAPRPAKTFLRSLLETYAPCVVLIDELVAYIRQFQEGQPLSGGSFDSNLSFLQALTEACKLVPNAVLLASLPESEVEAGSQRGVAALRALGKDLRSDSGPLETRRHRGGLRDCAAALV